MSILSSVQQPSAPAFNPADIGGLGDLALQYDTLSYDLGQSRLGKMFPGLVNYNSQDIAKTAAAVNGPLPPSVQGNLVQSGIAHALSTYGGGAATAPNLGGEGSAARGTVADDVIGGTNAYQDMERGNLAQLFATNPLNVQGFTGQEATNIAIANALGEFGHAYQAYQGNVAGANAANQLGNQQFMTSLQIAMAIAAAAGSDERLKTNIVEIERSPKGLRRCEFEYVGTPGKRFRGTLAQWLLTSWAAAAVLLIDDFYAVDYSMTDIVFEEVTP